MSINIFKKYRILLLSAIGFIATYCANPVSPTGGPRDKTPPVITEEVPVNYSTQFNLDRILVSFDEFVQLNDLNNQLIISPLMNEKPDINPKGKAIQIKFNEELKDHTTYTLFFGDAIVDFTAACFPEILAGGVNDGVYYGVSTSATFNPTSVTGPYTLNSNLGAGDVFFGQICHWTNTFPVTAGAVTFYARARLFGQAVGAAFQVPTMRAIFVPAAY